jgi:hypothetical protein
MSPQILRCGQNLLPLWPVPMRQSRWTGSVRPTYQIGRWVLSCFAVKPLQCCGHIRPPVIYKSNQAYIANNRASSASWPRASVATSALKRHPLVYWAIPLGTTYPAAISNSRSSQAGNSSTPRPLIDLHLLARCWCTLPSGARLRRRPGWWRASMGKSSRTLTWARIWSTNRRESLVGCRRVSTPFPHDPWIEVYE